MYTCNQSFDQYIKSTKGIVKALATSIKMNAKIVTFLLKGPIA